MKKSIVIGCIFMMVTFLLIAIVKVLVFFQESNLEMDFPMEGPNVFIAQPIFPTLVGVDSTSATVTPIPRGFEGFKEWGETKRIIAVTELEKNIHLSNEAIAFLKTALRDKELSDLVRNNAANALLAQEPKDATLYRVFLDLVGDTSQSATWRCYSIQFLAETLPYCANRVEVTKRLHDLTRDNDQTLASQAMMMLAYAADRGEVELEKGFDDRLVERLRAPNATDEMKMATLQLLGRRDMRQHVNLVREQVSKPSSYQRVAIASLGQLGDESDVARLEPLTRSHDNLLSVAARSALARLKGKP